MAKIKLLNYVIGAIAVEEDDDGNILRKIIIDPVEAFGKAEVQKAIAEVERVIAEGMPGLPPQEEPKPNRAARRSKPKPRR